MPLGKFIPVARPSHSTKFKIYVSLSLAQRTVRLFTTCVKIAFYSLSPDSLRTMVLMRKDVLYECVKTYVMRRKEDPYAFFTQSLRTRKFNFSCCVEQLFISQVAQALVVRSYYS